MLVIWLIPGKNLLLPCCLLFTVAMGSLIKVGEQFHQSWRSFLILAKLNISISFFIDSAFFLHTILSKFCCSVFVIVYLELILVYDKRYGWS